MSVTLLVDSFVAGIHAGRREPLLLEEVPAKLRIPLLNEYGEEDGLSRHDIAALDHH
jgi:hypothetical protein